MRIEETHELLQESIYEFTKENLAGIAAKIDRENEFPKEIWQKLGSYGYLGVTAPEKYGGAGLDYLSHCIIMQAISAASASVGLSYAAHSNLCINQIVLNGNEAQKSYFLPKLISGEHIGALAISESNAGSDAVGMQLRATRKGSHFILNGSKMWITNGPNANTIVVYAKTDKAAKSKGITAFIVDSKETEIIRQDKIDKLGMRGSNTCELIFDDAIVPASNVLGEVNKGTAVMMRGLDYERVILAAGPVGIMEGALAACVPYIQERKQFGQAIGQFQLIQAKIADMYTLYRASQSYLYSSAIACDRGIISRKDAASVILFTAENATKVSLEAIQCFGGNGYTNEYPVARMLRDAKLYEIGAGTNEIRRSLIGREIFNGN